MSLAGADDDGGGMSADVDRGPTVPVASVTGTSEPACWAAHAVRAVGG